MSEASNDDGAQHVEPTSAPPGQVTFSCPSAVCWALEGPAGPVLDMILAVIICAGIRVERIANLTRYRLIGSYKFLQQFADEVAKVEGHTLTKERAPEVGINLSAVVAPPRPARRTTFVQGRADAFSWIARAVDQGLHVSAAGINRWAVTGSSVLQMQWFAAQSKKTMSDALKTWGVTAESIAAEDAHGVEVTVSLPTREITTDLMNRDDMGNLTKVIQTERSV